MNTSNLVPAFFSFDGEGTPMKGLHDPKRNWNGWSMPYISADSIPNLISQLNVEYYKASIIDGDKLSLIYIDCDELIVDLLEPINIDGQIYYDFAWLGFTFEKIDYEERLHQEARDLMDTINYVHKWDSLLSLDEYLLTHFDDLTNAEMSDIQTLLDKFNNL